MRIAVVEPEGRGGMAQYAFQLCRAMSAEGADVTLVTGHCYELTALDPPFAVERRFALWDPKPPAGSAASRGRLRRLSRAVRYVRQWRRAAAWLEAQRFDVVQLGDLRFPLLWPLVSRLAARVRRRGGLLADVCHNVHPFASGGAAAGAFRRGALTRLAYDRMYRLFDPVFVHYPVNREAFLATYRLPGERVEAIPLGNMELLDELRDRRVDAGELRRRAGLPPDAPVVLLFGTLSPYKGIDLLIEAFARLPPRHAGARLLLAGFPLPGFDLAAERRRAARLGVGERVRFVPGYLPLEEVAAWMELAAVAAFPYRGGFQSAAVQAALAFGVPVVASAVGAMGEMLAPLVGGEGARLVPPGDAAALAAALDGALRADGDPAARRRRAESCRRLFSWRHPASAVLDAYRRRLDAPAGAAGREAAR